jgi:hypothetical protein
MTIADHAVALGDQWSVWRDAVLRTAGFPADGLSLLSDPGCAEAADGHLAGEITAEQFDEVFDRTAARLSCELHHLASDPLLREAITWQNLSALISVEQILKAGPEPRRNARHRGRERMLTRYWQRYCGKVETVGFFGPVCWVRIDPAEPVLTVRPGGSLIRDRTVYFDYWPLDALAGKLAAQLPVRASLAPRLSAQLTLRHRDVIDPVRPPLRLTAAQASVVSRCDGRKPGWRVAEEVLADPEAGLRSPADVYLMLDRLVRRGILRWDFDLAVSLDAECLLRERIGHIADAGARAAAEAELGVLATHRADVAAAAGTPERLAEALIGLESAFTQLCGQAATRNAGQMYAGRTLCVEETTRDLDVTFGRGVLDAIAAPLAVPLTVVRWLCGALARAYCAHFERLCAGLGSDDVPLGVVWFLAQDAFYGTGGDRPADQVMAELARRWARLFGLDSGPPQGGRLDFSSQVLAGPLAELFPAVGPAWAMARIHSPDLQICARDAGAFHSGDFSVVLSELHAAWPASNISVCVRAHPDQDRIRQAFRRDTEGRIVHPLLPLSWPRHTPRLAFALEDPPDAQLGFAPAPGADPARLLPISSLLIRRGAAGLDAVAPDGRIWPLIDIFGRLLSEVAVDAFKSLGGGPHTPRITIDRLVVARETWRSTVTTCPVTMARGERAEYLAARRWRAGLGLPERVFVKLGTEVKPIFVDLTSPAYVSVLAAALRAARREQGDAATVLVSEMLPTPEQCWIPDAEGNRYAGELRLHVRDDQAVLAAAGGEP